MPKHPFQCSGNRTRTCVRRGGYEPEVLLTSVKQKKDAEASSFNVAGTGLEPVSESACPPWWSGYEPEVLLTSVKQKKDAEASSFNVAGTGLEPVTFGL
jgi:hypothetical protein